jgi:hypothetical protein
VAPALQRQAWLNGEGARIFVPRRIIGKCRKLPWTRPCKAELADRNKAYAQRNARALLRHQSAAPSGSVAESFLSAPDLALPADLRGRARCGVC